GGGLGFLAAGYLSASRLRADVDALRELDDGKFGVNVFVGGGRPAGPQQVAVYAGEPATSTSSHSTAPTNYGAPGINARPPWRSRDIEERVDFGRWLRRNIPDRFDTGNGTPEDTAIAIATWVNRHISDIPEGSRT
ncbi:MAG TPA: nitronate monooxygenase, partial [Trebonia sp.]